MKREDYETGYFGSPVRVSKVHLVSAEFHAPVCGAALAGDMQYQWCSMGINLDYIECENCLRTARKILTVTKKTEGKKDK